MCVTFTGCELLCRETLNRLNAQQQSHATLKSKLRVQIKMKVMKGTDKGLKGLRLNQASERAGMEWEAVPPTHPLPWGGGNLRKATSQVCALWTWPQELGHPRQLPVQPEPGEIPQVLTPLTPVCRGGEGFWGGRSGGVPSSWIWGPESHPSHDYVMILGTSHPLRGWFSCSPLCLTETKMRLNVRAKIMDKDHWRWTWRWAGVGGHD